MHAVVEEEQDTGRKDETERHTGTSQRLPGLLGKNTQRGESEDSCGRRKGSATGGGGSVGRGAEKTRNKESRVTA